MTVAQARPLHRTRAGRLLALLLAVLLSVTSLAGHAAMDACASDCTTAQVEMVDSTDPECGACAALGASPLVASAHPDTLVGIATPAVVEVFSPPPHQPPRP
ncbi:hypothetical protein [Halomonas daqiaonensis]|uniref:DUF2946 domain-containing protein n=1 Tax=Halomonas daqiaonensis TaxID=650850 RepID=A0A1H7JD72_9GAMM|nr:hypothetical protein [Halomonas daqiaonensis]SEK71837.1 hypothetical protein SAMN04488129_10416 [Halomonas daqiaonensis]